MVSQAVDDMESIKGSYTQNGSRFTRSSSVFREHVYKFVRRSRSELCDLQPRPVSDAFTAQSFLSARERRPDPEPQSDRGGAAPSTDLELTFSRGGPAVVSCVLRDLRRPRGPALQPQLLSHLPEPVLEQEDGQARVSCVQEEVLAYGAHRQPRAEERV